LGAHAIALHRLDNLVREHLSTRPTGDLLREFTSERNEFFDEQRGRFVTPCARGDVSEPVGRVGGGSDHAHALAVVAAAWSLDHSAAAVIVEKRLQLIYVRHSRPVRLRYSEFCQTSAHDELVLSELQGVR